MLASLSWGTVALPEVLWTFFGLCGVYFTQHNFREYLKDLDAIQSSPEHDGILTAIAHGHLRTETGRTLIHAITIMVGIAAMLTPPANPHIPISPLQLIITIGLFAINAVTVSQSVLDRRLLSTIEAMDEGGES